MQGDFKWQVAVYQTINLQHCTKNWIYSHLLMSKYDTNAVQMCGKHGNAVFTSLLHRACKCVSKYGIYHVCHTFAPRLHHICSWVNVSVQRNITDFFKAWITTDGIKIFSITFSLFFNCICKIAKNAFRIVLYVTTFYSVHAALSCSSFRFKTMICLGL